MKWISEPLLQRATEDPAVRFNCEETREDCEKVRGPDVTEESERRSERASEGQFAFHFKAVGRFLAAESY